MVIYYDEDHLWNRQETFLTNPAKEILYRGIYDFSYKYRSRVFDPQGRELGYVQLDITSFFPHVDLCDPEGNRIAFLEKNEGYLLEPDQLSVKKEGRSFRIEDVAEAENGKLNIRKEDPLKYVLLLFAMVEIERKKI